VFLNSPNGTTYTDEDLEKMVYMPDKRGICIYHGTSAGIYEFDIKDNTGWIKALAIDPDFQGNGIGKKVLNSLICELKRRNVDNIELCVISANKKAVRLYESSGFVTERVVSYWFKKHI
jgi:Acetyltransferase (GNAT) family.